MFNKHKINNSLSQTRWTSSVTWRSARNHSRSFSVATRLAACAHAFRRLPRWKEVDDVLDHSTVDNPAEVPNAAQAGARVAGHILFARQVPRTHELAEDPGDVSLDRPNRALYLPESIARRYYLTRALIAEIGGHHGSESRAEACNSSRIRRS